MKYQSPKYELTNIQAIDVITASPNSYEIEEDKENKGFGNIIIKASSIF